ncbi:MULTISPECIES: peptidylprolyl isomerase [Roseivirga]|jgi:cyclophilin family peptidyl-prolyl cis-trans isomerase|uniref:peptidylprolyl isomerase n=1 Tax=Roseivirga TaxID=290180 RepID=UPI00273FD198|nr:peptidylprolyl isomerase [Roseivirga thermotolerans]MEC7753004.1 peptidylprolyl isomerase [Bacteroidota bacterium]|tara:strand:- start:18075 stop:19004 length:930 start_codon:yes stop_codon:yes gene_type:complete
MIRQKIFLAVVAVFLLTMACDSSGEKSGSETTKAADLSGNDYLVTIKTNFGEMKAVLYDKTPKHKENFIKLAQEKFYDSLLFHRVIQGFMIQCGDPESKNAAPDQNLGSGGPGYTIPAEFVPQFFHKKGALSAARQPDFVNPEKASSGSQFFVVQGQVLDDASLGQFSGPNLQAIGSAAQYLRSALPDHDLNREYQQAYEQGGDAELKKKLLATIDQLEEATGRKLNRPEMSEEQKRAYKTIGGTPFLDGDYTVFGEVISGLDIIDSIAGVQTKPGDRPVEDVRMYVSVEEMPKKEIAEKYGYDYSNQQ